MKTCLPSLKSSFDKKWISHVLYKKTCNVDESTYVIKICHYVTTKITGHQKPDLSIGNYFSGCCGSAKALNFRITDQCNDTQKLITVKTLHIRQQKPKLNMRDEYRGEKLALKYYSDR